VFEIGNSLREARTRRQIDFGQAELATKIRVRYLRALEDERFEQLPSQTYVKGFLRTYADYLGLDGQLYVDEFNSRFATGDDHQEGRPRRSSARPERRTRRLETVVVIAAVALVAIVTLVVTSAWQTSGSGTKAPQVTQHAQTKKKTSLSRPGAYLEIVAVSGPSYVTVHRGGATGRLLFQGTISKGRSEPFRGRYFWISVSSPENLRITVAGKRVEVGGYKPVSFIVNPTGVHGA
jgi:cytoskeleton protein RodZ